MSAKGKPTGRAVNAGNVGALIQLADGQPPAQAKETYQKWLKANPNHPQAAIVWLQVGGLHAQAKDFTSAVSCFQKSAVLMPNFYMARRNLALCLEQVQNLDAAIAEWKKIVQKIDEGKMESEGLTNVLNHLARLYETQGKWPEASEPMHRSFKLDPSQNEVLYHLIRMRQRLCDWPVYQSLEGVSYERVLENTSALAMLSISDDPQEQKAAALRNSNRFFKSDVPSLGPKSPYRHNRIRIGYASSNFGMHAVSFLTASLFELHDRTRFEVFAYCWSPTDNTPMRQRVIQAFDHYIPVHHMTDEAVAQQIVDNEIDILVDLQGLTTGARPQIFAYKPAPLQISYLGHPGTCCVPGVDHLVADRVLIPEDQQQYYHEKIMYMPLCFQINDVMRSTGVQGLTRKDFGLSENAFVFCAHNNTNKITPEIFAAWMQILQRTQNTVLWVISDNKVAEQNLRKEMRAAGVPEERVVISGQAGYEQYLARLSLGDIMLDTFPFNGGTTTSDALWMGLPVLTLQGRSFAARMSSSLVSAYGLSLLVATSLNDYIEKAIALASNRPVVAQMKAVLQRPAIQAFYQARIREYEDLVESTFRAQEASA
jgi:predicted O-linked N-acetylglucosamine transferase (SPINDLY family)